MKAVTLGILVAMGISGFAARSYAAGPENGIRRLPQFSTPSEQAAKQGIALPNQNEAQQAMAGTTGAPAVSSTLEAGLAPKAVKSTIEHARQ
jgi:hypothetical protein